MRYYATFKGYATPLTVWVRRERINPGAEVMVVARSGTRRDERMKDGAGKAEAGFTHPRGVAEFGRAEPGAGDGSNTVAHRTRTELIDVEHLPPTLTPREAFDLLGVGRTAGYESIRRKEIPALRLGGKLLVPTASLLRMIGVEAQAKVQGGDKWPV